MTIPATPRAADPKEFFTYRNPADYAADWVGYYDEATKKREELLLETTHEVGVMYGDNSYQFANIYLPEDTGHSPESPAPFIVYLHGGRWREGHPDYYDCLARPWLEEGAVFGSFGYRLEPEWTISDSIDDCAAAVRWAVENAERFGADPDNIILAGHSAGAHLIEMVALTSWVEDKGEETDWLDFITGIVCMSGPSVISDLIPDEPNAAEISPALRISRIPPNIVVSHGDPEPNKKGEKPGVLTESSRSLVRALQEFGARPTVVELGDVDHVQSGTAFADRTSPLFSAAHKIIFSERKNQ